MTCVLVHWFFILIDYDCCWIPLVNFLCHLLYSSAPKFLFCSVLYFLFLFLKFSFYSCIISLSLLSIFMMVTLNSSSSKSYTSILYGWFSGIYFVPLIGSFPPVSSCSMWLWVCIYPFKTTATSPSLLWAGSIQGKIFTSSSYRFWRPLKPFLWMFFLLTCVCRFLIRRIFQFLFNCHIHNLFINLWPFSLSINFWSS